MELSIFSTQIKIFFIIFTSSWLTSCDSRRAGATDVESTVHPIAISQEDQLLAHTTFELFKLNQDSLMVLDTFTSDSLGFLHLPDSLDNNLHYGLYASLEDSSQSAWQWLDKTPQEIQFQNGLHLTIEIQSESIYGNGEADSALFIFDGTPFWIECGTEPKSVFNLPRATKFLRIQNINGAKLFYSLPEFPSTNDSLDITLFEDTLIIHTLNDTLYSEPNPF